MSPTTASYTGHRGLTLAGFLAIALGAAHLGITALGYRPLFRIEAVWFAGTAVAIILIGVLTLFARNAPAGSMERWAAAAANAAGLLVAVAYSVLNRWGEIRGYVEIAVFAVGLVAALRGGRPIGTPTAVNTPPRA